MWGHPQGGVSKFDLIPLGLWWGGVKIAHFFAQFDLIPLGLWWGGSTFRKNGDALFEGASLRLISRWGVTTAVLWLGGVNFQKKWGRFV